MRALKQSLTAKRANARGVAASAPAAFDIRVPDFDSEIDPTAFPGGVPVIKASSVLTPELAAANLTRGGEGTWHSAFNPKLPQAIELSFSAPFKCVRLWMQSQSRFPQRAPIWFNLATGENPETVGEFTPPLAHKWTSGDEWAGIDLRFQRAWPFYRLRIFAAEANELITLQRLWLEPEGWRKAG